MLANSSSSNFPPFRCRAGRVGSCGGFSLRSTLSTDLSSAVLANHLSRFFATLIHVLLFFISFPVVVSISSGLRHSSISSSHLLFGLPAAQYKQLKTHRSLRRATEREQWQWQWHTQIRSSNICQGAGPTTWVLGSRRWWHSKKSVKQSLEAWPHRRECRGHKTAKKSVRTGAACSVGKACTHTRLNWKCAVRRIAWRSTWENETQAVPSWYKFSEFKSLESSDSVQNNEGNQETKRNRGAKTRKQATKERRQVSELISPACWCPPFLHCRREYSDIFDLGRGWKCPVATALWWQPVTLFMCVKPITLCLNVLEC